MGERVVYTDDLDGTDLPAADVVRDVVITIETSEGVHKGSKPLLLKRATYAALTELADGDADGVRQVFTPHVRTVRTPEEMARIRTAARAAKNADGSPMFPGDMIKDKGRQPEVVYTWYTTEFLPEQARLEAEAATPTKGGKRS